MLMVTKQLNSKCKGGIVIETDTLDQVLCSKYPEIKVEDVRMVKSPLRICPFGAHIDHQNGLVAGLALNISIDMAYVPNDTGYIRVQSLEFPEEDNFHINNVPPMVHGSWGNYLRGAVLALEKKFVLKRGIYAIIKGNYPIGGLSSSAAVTTAYLLALCDVNEIEISKLDLIMYSHWVEASFIGLKNGLLDQSMNILSRDGFLTIMDTKTETYELIPKPKEMAEFKVVIIYSGITQSLIDTGYNTHVDECKVAAWLLSEAAGFPLTNFENAKLRDIDYEIFETYKSYLPGRFRKKAEHFYGEMNRVKEGILAWNKGDLCKIGNLMIQSGESSINNYECGCSELVTIFNILKSTRGVYGARFSGAGYRGSCIGFIDPSYEVDIKSRIDEEYPIKHPDYANLYQVNFAKTDNGARIVGRELIS